MQNIHYTYVSLQNNNLFVIILFGLNIHLISKTYDRVKIFEESLTKITSQS